MRPDVVYIYIIRGGQRFLIGTLKFNIKGESKWDTEAMVREKKRQNARIIKAERIVANLLVVKTDKIKIKGEESHE